MSLDRRQFMKVATAAASVPMLSGIPLMAYAQAKGGVLNVVVQPEPPGLMIGVVANVPSHLVAGNIYEGLMRYDADLTPRPLLATSWTKSDDGLTYTFKLKENVTWHDGKPFTADDVVFSCHVFLRETHPRARTVLAYVENVTALDSHTVEFKLTSPFAPFMHAFEVGSMPMVPKHIYEGTEFINNPAHNTPIGTGPLKFNKWEKGSYIHLVGNENYHEDGIPAIEGVYFHVIPDAASRAAAYETGKVDILPGGSIEYFDIQRVSELPNTSITDKGWEFIGSHSFLWLNNRVAPLSNVKFRQAIMYALDREKMRDVAFFGFARVATGPFNSSTRFFTPDVRQYPHDLEQAKSLIAESGYDGRPIRLLPLPYGETWQRLAEIARQNLTEAGINVELTATDVAGWNEKLAQWDFDIAFTYMSQLGDPALGVSRNYTTNNIIKGSPWNNVSGFSNPELDRLFNEGASEIDDARRAQLYHDAQRLIAEEVPLGWLFELVWPTIYRSNIQNLITSAVGLNDGIGRARIE